MRRQTELNPWKPMRDSLKQVQKDAARVGLFVTYYNPGDNPQFKVATVDADYFALTSYQTVHRCTTLKAVRKFVEGYNREG